MATCSSTLSPSRSSPAWHSALPPRCTERVAAFAMALKAEARLGRARLPLRSILLSVQVAITVVLLASAGVLARGLQRAQTMDAGFDVQNVTVLSIDLP